jgi:hypothetical protein
VGTHYPTNDKASVPDSVYPGAESRLITDHDNDSIKGICTSAAAPTNTGPKLPGKKPHASGKDPWTGTKAANILTSVQGQGSRISHAPSTMTGQDKTGQGIHPPYLRALGKSKEEASQPGRADHHEDLEAKQSRPREEVAYGTLSSTIHLIIKKSPEHA